MKKMIRQMIVNRVDDWFRFEDLELDDSLIAMKFLIRLSTRTSTGFKYDRVNLSTTVLGRNSSEAIHAIDKAIVILISRKLIRFQEEKQGNKKIFITDEGIKAVEEYKELIRNVDKFN